MEEYLRSLNFDPPDFTPDGKLHRFSRNGSKDSAWYVAWQNARLNDGTFYIVVCFGDWRTGESHVYKPDKMTRAENIAIDEQIRQKQTEIQKEQERVRLEVSDKAEKRFNAAKKVGTTAYMAVKQIPDLYGACIYEDRLQIPMRDVDGVIWSLQTIMPDGQKMFMKGGRKKGCFHVIGAELSDDGFYVCEGFATGASIHQATGKSVVVAFDAGNLVEVVSELAKKYTAAAITICGDDDRSKAENQGRKKAEKAGLLSNGAVVFPQFPESDTKSTDFNDLHVRYGLDHVRVQLVDEPVVQQNGFVPLGYDGGNYFFYHIPSKDIVNATTFSPVQMYRLAPLDYWEARYPTKKGGVDLGRAAHDLIQSSSAIGPFDSTRIRGTGVWLDKNRVVINTGHSLVVEGRETSLSSLSSWHIYIQTRNRMPPLHPRILTVAEGERLVRTCQTFHWDSPNDGILLAGWLALARVAAALPVRPHVWITGGKGTGKSTLMESLIAPMLGSPKGKIHLIGATTEAGIRQAIKASALPVIFDEFESTGKSSRDRIDSIVELLRNSWSTSEGKIVKGSASGSSVEYQLGFAALVSSIRVRLENDADRSRFSVLELNPHGDKPEQWATLRNLLAVVDTDLGERLFARSCANVHNILANYELLSVELARAVSQRYGQQVGMLLASWYSLVSDEPITAVAAKSVAEDFSSEDRDTVTISDEEECLLHLLTQKITPRTSDSAVWEMSISEAIVNRAWYEALLRYGIKQAGEFFLVANKHAVLETFYRGTRWEGNWARALKRLHGAVVNRSTSSFGSRENISKYVAIPIAAVKQVC